MGNFVSGTPNEAVLIAGLRDTRVAVGTTTWRWWVINSVHRFPLEVIQLELNSHEAETVHGVKVTVKAIANVKVKARADEKKEGNSLRVDKENILTAAQQFLGKTAQETNNLLKQALEGHQRQILGTLTVEQVFRDRAAFSSKVREHCHEDLEKMGFQIISYTIKSIEDSNGYMTSLGATQTAIVKREAAEGEAKNRSEAEQKVALAESQAKTFASKAQREANVSVNQQLEIETESTKNLEMKRAETALQVGQAKQKADAALKTQQKVIETEVAEREARRLEVEFQGKARAKVVEAEAEAERIRIIARGEADALRLRGEAEAENIRRRAEAFNAFGQNALAHLLIEKLPEIAAEVAKPLAQTDKITFVSSGDGQGGGGLPSALTRDITTMMSQLPHSIQAMTGFDLREAIQNSVGKQSENPPTGRAGSSATVPNPAGPATKGRATSTVTIKQEDGDHVL